MFREHRGSKRVDGDNPFLETLDVQKASLREYTLRSSYGFGNDVSNIESTLDKHKRERGTYMSIAFVYCLKVNMISGARYHLVATYYSRHVEKYQPFFFLYPSLHLRAPTHLSHEPSLSPIRFCRPHAPRQPKVTHFQITIRIQEEVRRF